MKREATEWEKQAILYLTEKLFVFMVCRNFYPIKGKMTPGRQWTTDLSKYFTKQRYPNGQNHLKRCSNH